MQTIVASIASLLVKSVASLFGVFTHGGRGREGGRERYFLKLHKLLKKIKNKNEEKNKKYIYIYI